MAVGHGGNTLSPLLGTHPLCRLHRHTPAPTFPQPDASAEEEGEGYDDEM